MKKIISILVLSLFFGGSAYAEIIEFKKCWIKNYEQTEPDFKTYNSGFDDLDDYNWKNCNVHIFEKVDAALDRILSVDAHNAGTILSVGSLYLQGNILNYLGKNSDDDLSLLPKQ